MKRSLQIALGAAVSGIFLYFAFRDVDLAAVWRQMRAANYMWLGGAALACAYSNWARAQRWRLFFSRGEALSQPALFRATMIGIAANNVIPLRVGEALRAYVLSRSQGIAFATGFTTVMLERIFDLLIVLLFVAFTLAVVPIPANATTQVRAAAQLVTIVVVIAILGVFLLLFQRSLVTAWLERLLKLLPARLGDSARHLLYAFLAGLAALTDPRKLFVLFAYSLWVWIWFAAVFWFGAKSLALDSAYGLPIVQASIAGVALVAIFIMIPAAPGFVGTYQAGCILALGIFGIPREESLSFSLLVHAVQFVTVNVIGVYCFLVEGMTVREAQQATLRKD